MKLRIFLLFAASVSFLNIANAQDKVYERNGGVIDAIVKQVSAGYITYKRFDNPEGPDYSIRKNEVEKIKYQNGTEDVFDAGSNTSIHEQTSIKEHTNYKSNILSIAPFQFTQNGLGFSLSYERSIDKAGIVAFCLPAMVIFSPVNNDDYYSYNGQTLHHTDLIYSVMPGIKIYPTGNKAKVKYAIGPSAVITSGEKTSYNYDPTSGNYTMAQQQRFVLGLLVQNYLNINPTPHLYLGLELGLGASYISKLGGVDQGTSFLAQGAFKLGYRF